MSEPFDTEDVARLRMALGRLSRILDRQSSGADLTRTQLSVLGTIGRRGPLRLGELAEIEGLNPTLLSRVIAKLTDLGLVTRTPDALDARASLVELTPEGHVEHQRIRAERSEILRAGLATLDADDARLVVAALPALEQLFEHMRDLSGATVLSQSVRS